MKIQAILVASVSLALWGCGSDSGGGGDAQSELADLLLAEEVQGADESCVRDRTAELSDDDARFLIDNIDATDIEGFSAEQQAWVESLLDCIDLEAQLDEESAITEDTATPEESTAAEETVTTDGSTTTAESETSETPATTERSSSQAELASVDDSGFATWASGSGEVWANAAALIMNNGSEDLFLTDVTFNYADADGTPVATESTYVNVIPAGESFPVISQTYTDLSAAMPVTLEITAFADPEPFFETDWIELELGPTTITPDEFFSTVSGTVTNTADEPLDFYEVSCLLRAEDGSIVGGAFTYPDRVAPGQTIAWEASVEEGLIEAGAVTAECRSIAELS